MRWRGRRASRFAQPARTSLAYSLRNLVLPLKPLFSLPVPLEEWPIADRGWATTMSFPYLRISPFEHRRARRTCQKGTSVKSGLCSVYRSRLVKPRSQNNRQAPVMSDITDKAAEENRRAWNSLRRQRDEALVSTRQDFSRRRLSGQAVLVSRELRIRGRRHPRETSPGHRLRRVAGA